jgi:hypothetical protein
VAQIFNRQSVRFSTRHAKSNGPQNTVLRYSAARRAPQPKRLGVRRLGGAFGRRLVAVEWAGAWSPVEPLNAALPGRQAGQAAKAVTSHRTPKTSRRTTIQRVTDSLKMRATFCLCLAVALFTGCTHLGPRTVAVDRFDYSTAVADSWKQQTLLNIVKLRYADLPVFVDVASIVSGYSMETSGNIGGQISSANAIQGNSLLLGAAGKFTDRPTITYVPMTGQKFLHGLLTPIDPKNIFFMLQAGYPADFLLALTVESLNGVRNRSATAGSAREADPEFLRALELMREVQAAGAVGMRVEEDKAKGQIAVLFFRRDDLPADIVEKQAEIRRLLKLPAGQEKFVLFYSPVRGGEGELAVNSRSMMQILTAFASYMDVPEAHLKDRSALAAIQSATPESRKQLVRIHSGKEKPSAAFAAVHYRGHWFWIDEGDWQTKRALTAVVFFFTLAETGDTGKLPLITIPAQ